MTPAEDRSEASVLAIGVPLGRNVDAEQGRLRFSLRHGREVVLLAPDDFRVWAQALRGQPASALRQWAHDNVGDGSAALDALHEARLVAEVSDGPAHRFFSGHRLVPRGSGLGNSAQRPEAFEIGGDDMTPRLALDAIVYSVWAASDGCLSLLEACRLTAEPAGLEVERVTRRVADVLPQLVSAAAAYVDVCPSDG